MEVLREREKIESCYLRIRKSYWTWLMKRKWSKVWKFWERNQGNQWEWKGRDDKGEELRGRSIDEKLSERWKSLLCLFIFGIENDIKVKESKGNLLYFMIQMIMN